MPRLLSGRGMARVASPLLALLPAAAPDDAWLVATRSAVPPGVEVAFDLAVGPAFPADGSPVEPEVVDAARLRLAGREEPLPPPTRTRRALRFRVPLRRAGVATLWVSLAPRELDRDSTEVAALLVAAAAPDSVRRAYLAQPGGEHRDWHERQTAHAATYALVSSPLRPAPAADTSWAVPTGAPLELVAARDPTRLRAGDSVAVRVLRARQPVFAFPVTLVGGGTALVRRSGPGGVVSFRLPRAGRWLLRAAEVRRPAEGRGEFDWESAVATLTVVAR